MRRLVCRFFYFHRNHHSVRERQSPDCVGFVSCQRQGLACHSRLISACGVAVPEQKSPPPACPLRRGIFRHSHVQAKVIRTNTYRNALRIRLQLLLESTLYGPLVSVENKELTETLTPLDATFTRGP